MSGTFTENRLGSFASGKKRYARCVESYVNKDNALGSGSPCITKGKIYQVYKEGDYYNPANAFKTYFKMIFIKDDNNNPWGLVEDLFDMDVEYASDYEVNQLRIKDLNTSTAVKGNSSDYSSDDSFDSDFDDDFESSNSSYTPRTSVPPRPLTPQEIRKQKITTLVIGGLIVAFGLLCFKAGIGVIGDFAKYQDNIKKQSKVKVFK